MIITLALTVIWFDVKLGGDDSLGRPGLCLAAMALVITAMGAAEVVDLLGSIKPKPSKLTAIGGAMTVVLFASAPVLWRDYPVPCPLGIPGWSLIGVAAAVGLAFVVEMYRYREPGESIHRVALSVFVIGYIGLLISFLVPLRLFGGNMWGITALLSLILIVKFSDSGAYTIGRIFGRHKMAPRLSPGKTIEGMVGAFVTGAVASWVVFQFLVPQLIDDPPNTPVWASLAYGLIVSAAGMIGDLAESLLKRDMQRKDSSSWLPGLGGVLDIMDSILTAAPAAFMCWAAGLVGPEAM